MSQIRYAAILLFLSLLGFTASSQQLHEKEIRVKEGVTYTDSLHVEVPQYYTMELDSGKFVFGYVLQQTVDVKITITDPAGTDIGRFDGPGRGRETFQFDTEKDGIYRIEVAPFKQESGEYEFTIVQVEQSASTPEARVDQLMAEYKGEVPGGAVLVMKDGRVLFSKSYGMASLTYEIPFNLNTRTNIGSTSKQFTAFAIALLEERGKLSLDDDVRVHIPELPEFDHIVRLKHLVSHTSGYREYLNALAMTGRNMSTELEREKVIRIVRRQPELQNIPGAEWNYNNTGFVLLAEVVERVTDTPFEDWMREEVFMPLGMDSTLVRTDPGQVVVNRSQGYTINKEGAYEEVEDLGGAVGAGGIYTTLQDLAQWIRNFEDPQIGSDSIINKMMTPAILNDGNSTNYGLGLFISEYKGLKYVQHGGADKAHRSMLMYFPEIDAAVITQSNLSSFRGAIPNQIADAFFEDHFEESTHQAKPDSTEAASPSYSYDPAKFEALTGRYELLEMPGFVMTFDREGDRIYAQATGQPKVDLKALTDSSFQIVGIPAKIVFHINEDGTADSLTLHQNGKHLAKRIDWNPDVEELKEYCGNYFSYEIETFYTISLEDSSLMLENYQIDEIELSPGDKDSFSAGFPITDLEFTRDENGKILGFLASNGRTKGVFFEKKD